MVNLTSGFWSALLDCSSVSATSKIIPHIDGWQVEVEVPYKLILGNNYDMNSLQLKGNFFRIDVISGTTCTGDNCYYSAYNPTFKNPPSFH